MMEMRQGKVKWAEKEREKIAMATEEEDEQTNMTC